MASVRPRIEPLEIVKTRVCSKRTFFQGLLFWASTCRKASADSLLEEAKRVPYGLLEGSDVDLDGIDGCVVQEYSWMSYQRES